MIIAERPRPRRVAGRRRTATGASLSEKRRAMNLPTAATGLALPIRSPKGVRRPRCQTTGGGSGVGRGQLRTQQAKPPPTEGPWDQLQRHSGPPGATIPGQGRIVPGEREAGGSPHFLPPCTMGRKESVGGIVRVLDPCGLGLG